MDILQIIYKIVSDLWVRLNFVDYEVECWCFFWDVVSYELIGLFLGIVNIVWYVVDKCVNCEEGEWIVFCFFVVGMFCCDVSYIELCV